MRQHDERLGDKMPDRRAVKWGDMKAGESTLSNEWHTLDACDPVFSEKWDDQAPSKAKMSEKWVDMENSSEGNKWDTMKQDTRPDPYAMHHSNGDRGESFKAMKKVTPETKVVRGNQTTEAGTIREI